MTLTKEQIDFMETSGVDMPRVAFLNRLDALCDMARRTVAAEAKCDVCKKRMNQSIDDFEDFTQRVACALGWDDGDKRSFVDRIRATQAENKRLTLALEVWRTWTDNHMVTIIDDEIQKMQATAAARLAHPSAEIGGDDG